MSGHQQNTTQAESNARYDFRLPLVSAADAGRSHRTRVHFHEHQADILLDIARRRAPTDSPTEDRTVRNHLLGVATEVAVATWRDGRIDRRIYNDGEGDGGVDVIASSKWCNGIDQYQVKSTREMAIPERTVTEAELEAADYFVLCCTDAPRSFVEIVGYTDWKTLQTIGTTYGQDEYLLSPQILYPPRGQMFSPDDVRDAVLR